METCLYLVATPIGNLEDITLRAIETLKKVDLVACEDTRTSNKLLANYGIKKKLISIHQHNEKDKTEFLINELINGKSIAYLSDAGTPAISDPGAYLVNQAIKLGIKVSPIPGSSSLVAAFSVAGIESTQFQFYGFLPNSPSKAKKSIKAIYKQPLPTIIFESPHRILKTLSLVRDIFGAKHKIFVARELTKIYETIYFNTHGERPTGPVGSGGCYFGQTGVIEVSSWYDRTTGKLIKQIFDKRHCRPEEHRLFTREILTIQ